MSWSSRARNAARRAAVWAAGLAVWGALAAAAAASGESAPSDVQFSAAVDKTAASVGEPIQLVITLRGNTAGVRLPAELPLPDGFVAVAQSQSTSLSMRAGVAERAVALTFVLIAQRPGTYQLGPFEAAHEGRTLSTEPIDITVKKAALPPNFKPQGPRYSL